MISYGGLERKCVRHVFLLCHRATRRSQKQRRSPATIALCGSTALQSEPSRHIPLPLNPGRLHLPYPTSTSPTPETQVPHPALCPRRLDLIRLERLLQSRLGQGKRVSRYPKEVPEVLHSPPLVSHAASQVTECAALWFLFCAHRAKLLILHPMLLRHTGSSPPWEHILFWIWGGGFLEYFCCRGDRGP